MEEILQKNNSDQNSVSGIKFTDPETIIDNMELQAGMTVADFGCGTGYFSLPIAKKIGEEGVVYALDILPEKLEVIESQVKMRNITNIIAKRVNLENKEGSQLGAGSADWVIMKDVLFQNKNKNQMLMEAKRILKDGGKILIIEWKKENTPIGPDNKIRISKEELKKLIIENGLGILKEINAGNFHYCLILIK